MKLLILLLYTVLYFPLFSYGQSSNSSFIPCEASGFEVDNIGNIYLYNDMKIRKINAIPPPKEFAYSNQNYGNITKIDVSNPLRILVFHKDQMLLELLDNTLSNEQNTVLDLTGLNLYNIQAFASSKIDNGIWFYDKDIFQLIKVSRQFELLYQSGNLLELLRLEQLNVTQLIEYKDKLYMITPEKILVFDMYGAYYTTIHYAHSGKISIANDKIFAYENNFIYIYDMTNFTETKLPVTVSNEAKFPLVKHNKIYFLTPKGLEIHSFKN